MFIYLCYFGVIGNVCKVLVNMNSWVVLLKLVEYNILVFIKLVKMNYYDFVIKRNSRSLILLC